jgi:hypothetical protein
MSDEILYSAGDKEPISSSSLLGDENNLRWRMDKILVFWTRLIVHGGREPATSKYPKEPDWQSSSIPKRSMHHALSAAPNTG